MLVENNFVILGSTRTVYTQQRKQQRGLLTKTMLLSLTADVRMGRNNLAYISAENKRKKDVHNQGSSLPWLWTVGGGNSS